MNNDVETYLSNFEDELVRGYAALLGQRHRRRRRLTSAAVVIGAALTVSVGTIGAVRFLSAPEKVQNDLAALDQGMPSDLRYQADVSNAHAVAEGDGVVLYAASNAKGGYCTEIVTDASGAMGAVCRSSSESEATPVGLTVAPLTKESGVVIGGRATPPGAASLELHYTDGSDASLSLSPGGYFASVLPEDKAEAVRSSGFSYIVKSSTGATLASGSVPADWNEAAPPDSKEAFSFTTVSHADDFTKVYGLEGRAHDPSIAKIVLELSDGTTLDTPVGEAGQFALEIPASRVGDFMRPQQLLAEDASGKVVSSRPVAAVAWWRAQSG